MKQQNGSLETSTSAVWRESGRVDMVGGCMDGLAGG